MKFLEAKAKLAKAEHKMQPGVRADQQDATAVPPAVPPAAPVVPISAVVRELAAELNVDLSTISGSGKDGAVLVRDVRANKTAMEASEPNPTE